MDSISVHQKAFLMSWTTLCTMDELTEGLGKFVDIGGKEFAIFLVDDQVHVIDNLCPHAGGSMSGGYVDDGCAVCPWHGWAFDLKSGGLRGSIGESEMLKVYTSRILDESGRRFVQIDLSTRRI